ncbi:MAG: bifunctional DNA-formamidopyrimidine glycosylase/DNA-(apurinic or apyrimidinic site) lyase [bacterium]
MPELPEVETIARGLARELEGATFASVVTARADYVLAPPPSVAAHLVGRRVVAVRRHGKRLALVLDPGGEMLLHLGMSGRVFVTARDTPAAPHTHLRLALEGRDAELRMVDPRRFGGVWICSPSGDGGRRRRARNGARPSVLGPDALGLGLRELRDVLARRRRIKALLLDQSRIAGLGNIYVDEALWAARIHPETSAADLGSDTVRALHRSLARILDSAIRHGGSTLRDYRDAEGRAGRFQQRHRVYGREGEPCPRCGRRIVVVTAAGRSSRICPACQTRGAPRSGRKKRIVAGSERSA